MITPALRNRGVSDAAKAAGISKSYMSQIASGQRTPRKNIARRLRRLKIDIPAATPSTPPNP